MKKPGTGQRTYTLRNAASVVFALTAVLPLLLFTYTLYALDKLQETQAQLGLGVALFFALIGLFIFSNLMGRLSEVLRYLEEATETGEGPAAHPAAGQGLAGARLPAEPRPAAAPSPAVNPHLAMGTPPGAPVRPPAPPARGIMVPGLGTIHSGKGPAPRFDNIQKSMWKTEAQPHLGRRVLVSVKNAPEPIAGNLAQITEDGVLLEQGGEKVAVSYLRITNIEADTRPASAP